MTGVVHPDELLTNAGGAAGDALVLTKPLGAGAVATAAKRGLEAPVAEARRGDDHAQPRRGAGRARGAARTRSPTSPASGCSATCTSSPRPAAWPRRSTPRPCPRSPACSSCSRTATTRGRRRNAAQPRPRRDVHDVRRPRCAQARRWLVCDAMTSGGLLAAVPAEARRRRSRGGRRSSRGGLRGTIQVACGRRAGCRGRRGESAIAAALATARRRDGQRPGSATCAQRRTGRARAASPSDAHPPARRPRPRPSSPP